MWSMLFEFWVFWWWHTVNTVQVLFHVFLLLLLFKIYVIFNRLDILLLYIWGGNANVKTDTCVDASLCFCFCKHALWLWFCKIFLWSLLFYTIIVSIGVHIMLAYFCMTRIRDVFMETKKLIVLWPWYYVINCSVNIIWKVKAHLASDYQKTKKNMYI